MTNSIKDSRAVLKFYGVNTLLTAPNANPKVAKNGKQGVLTTALHLAPYNTSGHQVCPMASAGCAAACLHTAGNPAYMAGKRRARDARTKAYFAARLDFMACLVSDIEKHEHKARSLGMQAGVRLNATSDIRWERVKAERAGVMHENIMKAFPNVEFYDYTKIHNRKRLPANYHLTYSLCEDNDAKAAKMITGRQARVAVVFDTKRGQALPAYHTIAGVRARVVDGDEHDFRPIDKGGWIIGLRAKGDAIGDKSGFVRSAA